MPSRISSTFLVLLAASNAAAAVLKGVVVENELGGRPLENVEVSASGANPIASDPFGKFTLEFPKLRPGESVRLIVGRTGYVVVNDVQLELALPADPDAKPVIILICREDNREEMVRRFYRLKSFEAIEATYRDRLKQAQGATAEALSALHRQRDQAKAAAEKAAEELAKGIPSESSAVRREAMRMFLDGKIERALEILDDDKLRRLVSEARKRRAEAEEAIGEAVRAWLLKAELFIVQFRFEEAESAYQTAIEVAPDNAEAECSSARFNQYLNRFAKAHIGYARCLGLLTRSGSKGDVAKTLVNKGNLDSAQNRMEEARKNYDGALNIYRELAEKNATYLADLATTLSNLGVLHHAEHRMNEARNAYEEALKIRRDLAQKDAETNLPDVAATLNNLANLDSDENRMQEAREAYEEAFNTYRGLAKWSEDTVRGAASTLNNLAILDLHQKRMHDARDAFVALLKVYRKLAESNPETYLPDVASTLVNLGCVYSDQHSIKEARSAYEDALKTYRGLAASNPETYLPHVATTLNDLGALRGAENRLDDARNAFEEALKIRRDLAHKSPETYLPAVAASLSNLGLLYRRQNQMQEAREAFEEALRIYKPLAERDPKEFQPELTRIEDLLRRVPQ